jgi:hypothetical protein
MLFVTERTSHPKVPCCWTRDSSYFHFMTACFVYRSEKKNGVQRTIGFLKENHNSKQCDLKKKTNAIFKVNVKQLHKCRIDRISTLNNSNRSDEPFSLRCVVRPSDLNINWRKKRASIWNTSLQSFQECFLCVFYSWLFFTCICFRQTFIVNKY